MTDTQAATTDIRRDLVDSLHAARETERTVFGAFDATERDTPPADGEWSPKDVQAHLGESTSIQGRSPTGVGEHDHALVASFQLRERGHGLGQRLAAVDGTLDVSSPDGGPTVLVARIPLASA